MMLQVLMDRRGHSQKEKNINDVILMAEVIWKLPVSVTSTPGSAGNFAYLYMLHVLVVI